MFESGESKEGLYDVYYKHTGEKIIVLNGLSIEDKFEAPFLQQQIHQYYPIIEIFYWVLFASIILYLSLTHLFIPIFRKSTLK